MMVGEEFDVIEAGWARKARACCCETCDVCVSFQGVDTNLFSLIFSADQPSIDPDPSRSTQSPGSIHFLHLRSINQEQPLLAAHK